MGTNSSNIICARATRSYPHALMKENTRDVVSIVVLRFDSDEEKWLSQEGNTERQAANDPIRTNAYQAAPLIAFLDQPCESKSPQISRGFGRPSNHLFASLSISLQYQQKWSHIPYTISRPHSDQFGTSFCHFERTFNLSLPSSKTHPLDHVLAVNRSAGTMRLIC